MDLCCSRSHPGATILLTGQTTERQNKEIVSGTKCFSAVCFLALDTRNVPTCDFCSSACNITHSSCLSVMLSWDHELAMFQSVPYQTDKPTAFNNRNQMINLLISCSDMETFWNKIKMFSGACCCWPVHSLFLYLFSLSLSLFLSSCMLLQP